VTRRHHPEAEMLFVFARAGLGGVLCVLSHEESVSNEKSGDVVGPNTVDLEQSKG
jgi:hypothetical protein